MRAEGHGERLQRFGRARRPRRRRTARRGRARRPPRSPAAVASGPASTAPRVPSGSSARSAGRVAEPAHRATRQPARRARSPAPTGTVARAARCTGRPTGRGHGDRLDGVAGHQADEDGSAGTRRASRVARRGSDSVRSVWRQASRQRSRSMEPVGYDGSSREVGRATGKYGDPRTGASGGRANGFQRTRPSGTALGRWRSVPPPHAPLSPSPFWSPQPSPPRARRRRASRSEETSRPTAARVGGEAEASTFVVRRARLLVEGAFDDRFRVRVMPDLGHRSRRTARRLRGGPAWCRAWRSARASSRRRSGWSACGAYRPRSTRACLPDAARP